MTPFAIIIPARYASSRYPGKPLATLRGFDGTAKSLIQRSWECAMAVEGAAGVWVATDDARIASAVEAFGGKVVMTSPECRNGTERCAEAIEHLGDVAEIVVNLQGDAPLSPAALIPHLVQRLAEQPEAGMATPAVRCSPTTLAHLRADAAAGRVGGTTAVFSRTGRALYFSKHLLPYLPADATDAATAVHLHLGLYAYRSDALARYRAAPPSKAELSEGLEQLRFLDQDELVTVLATEPFGWDPIELNNPSDVPVIEAILRERGQA